MPGKWSGPSQSSSRTTIPRTHHSAVATSPDMSQNATLLLTESQKSYLSTVHPWYYEPGPQLWSVMSDHWLSFFAYIIVYWLLCFFFEILDWADWEWLKRYRIHESSEVTSRNRVTKGQVAGTVIFQQVMQVTLGYFWIDMNVKTGGPVSIHVPRMEVLAPTVLRSLEALVGRRLAAYLWLHKAQELVYYVYWWAVPLAQLFAGL
jgi:sphinganine C4-monooxygenase